MPANSDEIELLRRRYGLSLAQVKQVLKGRQLRGRLENPAEITALDIIAVLQAILDDLYPDPERGA